MAPITGYRDGGERYLDPVTAKRRIGVIRVIENQITALRPYNARYTDDNRSIFRKRNAEIITRVSPDLRAAPAVKGRSRFGCDPLLASFATLTRAARFWGG
jgi:hypothetical protein